MVLELPWFSLVVLLVVDCVRWVLDWFQGPLSGFVFLFLFGVILCKRFYCTLQMLGMPGIPGKAGIPAILCIQGMLGNSGTLS